VRLGEPAPFEGHTYVDAIDGVRLGAQLRTVLFVMSDGAWRTLEEIREVTDYPEASISARLRDIRKPRFARTHTMDSRRRAGSSRGLWEYRVRPVTDHQLTLWERRSDVLHGT
jgi:hypothetical protein